MSCYRPRGLTVPRHCRFEPSYTEEARGSSGVQTGGDGAGPPGVSRNSPSLARISGPGLSGFGSARGTAQHHGVSEAGDRHVIRDVIPALERGHRFPLLCVAAANLPTRFPRTK